MKPLHRKVFTIIDRRNLIDGELMIKFRSLKNNSEFNDVMNFANSFSMCIKEIPKKWNHYEIN
jgi:hypothetical protein